MQKAQKVRCHMKQERLCKRRSIIGQRCVNTEEVSLPKARKHGGGVVAKGA